MSDIKIDQRIAILVDTANMYHSAKSRFKSRVDYKRLLEMICRGRKVVRAIAFVMKSEDVEIKPFTDALHAVGFETRVKVIKRHNDHKSKGGNWDVGIALCATELASKVDCISLVSGDGDFIDLIEYLDQHGVRTEIYAFEGCVSSELMEKADGFYPLTEEWLISTDQLPQHTQHTKDDPTN